MSERGLLQPTIPPGEEGGARYEIPITDKLTGETRVFVSIEDTAPSLVAYYWGDGNFGCDCNRSIAFAAVETGRLDIANAAECGETRFYIPHIIYDGGRKYDIDDADQARRSRMRPPPRSAASIAAAERAARKAAKRAKKNRL